MIVQKWQFKRLDIAAEQLRRRLDAKNDFYQEKDDARLECASNKQLERDLRDMNHVSAEAKQVLTRLDAGIKTLEINHHHLERHLQRSGQVWQSLDDTLPDEKCNWQLTWEYEMYTPLSDGFDLDKRHLQNHATYIQDALVYLDSIRARWQLHLEGRRLQYGFNIQIMLLVLTFIASFTGIIAFITQNPKYITFFFQGLIDEPQQFIEMGHLLLIGVNVIILIFLLLPFFYLYMKLLWKKFRCFMRQQRESLF